MSSIRYSSVHTELIALHLVELVSGIWVLTWSDHCCSNIQILVEVLPADFTWTQTDTNNKHKKKTKNMLCFIGTLWGLLTMVVYS